MAGLARFSFTGAESVEDLEDTKTQFMASPEWAAFQEQHGDGAQAMIDKKMRDRQAQLQQQEWTDVEMMLHTPPFLATQNLPEEFSTFCDSAKFTSLLDPQLWAPTLEALEATLGSTFGSTLQALAAEVRRTLERTTPSVIDIPVLGLPHSGRSSLLDSLIGAGPLLLTSMVGVRIAPVRYVHDPTQTTPLVTLQEARRVVVPLQQVSGMAPPVAIDDPRGLTGSALVGLLRFLHSAAAAVIQTHGEQALCGVLRDPPEVRLNFSCLRGTPFPLSFTDIPFAEARECGSLARVLLERAETVVLADSADRVLAAQTPGATAAGVSSTLWSVLRDYTTRRQHELAPKREHAFFEGEMPAPLIVVLTHKGDLPTTQVGLVSSRHFSLRRLHISVPIEHFFVVSCEAASVASQLFDIARTSFHDTGDHLHAKQACLSTVKGTAWERILGRDADSLRTFRAVLQANEGVWVSAKMGELLTELFRYILSIKVLPDVMALNESVFSKLEALMHECSQSILDSCRGTNCPELEAVATLERLVKPTQEGFGQVIRAVESRLSQWHVAPKEETGLMGSTFVQTGRASLAHAFRSKLLTTKLVPSQVTTSAAAKLAGTDSRVEVPVESLKKWWTLLPKEQRITDPSGAVVFSCQGAEVALRLAYGVSEVTDSLANSQSVDGQQLKTTVIQLMSTLASQSSLWNSTVGKFLSHTFTPLDTFVPPAVDTAIRFVVTEHPVLNASFNPLSMNAVFHVEECERMAEQEMKSNISQVNRFAVENSAALENFIRNTRVAAAESLACRGYEMIPKALSRALHTLRLLTIPLLEQLVSFGATFVAAVAPADVLAKRFGIDCHQEKGAARLVHVQEPTAELQAEWRRWTPRVRQKVLDNALAQAKTLHDMQTVSLIPREVVDAMSQTRDIPEPVSFTPTWQQQGRKKTVMCLCGGGVRGVITALLVQQIDAHIQEFTADSRKPLRLWDVVDEFIGTSTGAIIAAMLSIGTDPASIVHVYKEGTGHIFPPSAVSSVTMTARPKYSPFGLREIARRYLGSRMLDDQRVYAGVARPKLLTCDMSAIRTRVWTCRDHNSFSDVLLAATAAPTFFPSHRVGSKYYCDAGLAQNHPGLECVKDMANVGFVCTIGTGEPASNYEFLNNGGLLQWAPHFADVLIDSSQFVCADVLESCFGERSVLLNPKLPVNEKMPLDDCTFTPRMVQIAEQYLAENAKAVEDVARKLLTQPCASE